MGTRNRGWPWVWRPLWPGTSQRGSVLRTRWGSAGSERDAEHQGGGTPCPSLSCTPALYTNLFISVQNHVSILHKEYPTVYPTLSPHQCPSPGGHPLRRGLSEALTSACPSWVSPSSTLEKINKEAQAEPVLGQPDSLHPVARQPDPQRVGRPWNVSVREPCRCVETPPWRPEVPGLQVGVLTLLGHQTLLGAVVG